MDKCLIVACLMFLAGCSDQSSGGQAVGSAVVNDVVKEVKLSDGTRCAVFQGVLGGGITCDWK